MKINELKAGKVYKPNYYEWTHNLYRINNNILEYKFKECEWKKSILTYNELLMYEFEEFKREIDWSKIPMFTEVEVYHARTSKWKKAYFVKYQELNEKPFEVTIYGKHTYIEGSGLCYNKCRLDKSVEIKEEWYKGIKK